MSPSLVVDVSTAEHASVVPRSAKPASAQHSFAVRTEGMVSGLEPGDRGRASIV